MKSVKMKELLRALDEIEKQEGIEKEFILESLISGLEQAYKEEYETSEDVNIEILKSGELRVSAKKEVVNVVKDPTKEIDIEHAKKFKKTAKVGDTVKEIIVPKNFGRIAVQKGKQIIIQALREREKQLRFDEFTAKKGQILTGMIQKVEPNYVILDLGKLEGIMPSKEMVPTEVYRVNDKIRVYVQDVIVREKGDLQVKVSRTDPGILRRLFENEIPEIVEGTIEIKAIARDAGDRAKVAVYSSNPSIDPVGSCLGQHGLRLEGIHKELNGEKVMVVEWSEDPAEFIQQALIPATVAAIDINEEKKFAQVVVPDDQLAVAIGKKGQNARLAVKLTNWKIDIKSVSQFKEILEKAALEEEQENVEDDETMEVADIDKKEVAILDDENVNDVDTVVEDADTTDVATVDGKDVAIFDDEEDTNAKPVEDPDMVEVADVDEKEVLVLDDEEK